MVTALVSGAAGFIGSHIVDELIARGINVIAVDNLSGGVKSNINDKAKFYEIDITKANDINDIEAIFELNKINYIFHLAAYAAEGLSHFIRRYNYTNNVIGSVNLINMAIKYNVRCFVFTSSIAVYGGISIPLSEAVIPRPEDPYGIAKFAVEMDLRAAHDMFGLNYIIFRPHNVYGPRQSITDRYRNVVGIFIRQLMLDQPLTVFGDGTQTRAFTFIDDIASTIAGSVFYEEMYGETFNIGCDTKISINTLATIMMKLMNKESHHIEYLEKRLEAHNPSAIHQKITGYFGILDTPIEVGLKETIDWVMNKPLVRAKIGKVKKFTNIEIYKNIPEVWTR